MTAALTGNYKPAHMFALMQSLELYDIYNEKAQACDREIQAVLDRLQQNSIPPDQLLPKAKYRECNNNAPAFDVRQTLFNIIGVDLTQITGLGSYLALKLVSECGTDMSKWPTDKHFTSWLCLSPGNKISGGKILSSRTRRSSSRVAALLRLAAAAIGRTETALGAFYRRLAARTGKVKAVTATARKIAVLFYNTLRYGMRYVDPGADYYEEQYKAMILKQLRRRADSYGFSLQPKEIPDTAIGVS